MQQHDIGSIRDIFWFVFFAHPKSINTQTACGMALFFPDPETEKQRGHEMPVI
jgi:hypothetical protein